MNAFWYNTGQLQAEPLHVLIPRQGLSRSGVNTMTTPDATTNVKSCTKCKSMFLATSEFFYRAPDNKDGLTGTCKTCYKANVTQRRRDNPERAKQYRINHRDSLRAKNKQYNATHREQISEKRKQWRDAHPEQVRENKKRFRRNHLDQIKEKDKQYASSHRQQKREYDQQRYIERLEQKRQQSAEYRNAHPNEVREVKRRWKRANRERVRTKESNRRAIKRALPATFTLADFRRAKVYFNYRCAYCGKGPKETDINWSLHQDHFVPLTASDCSGTVPWNIIPACQSCNLSKHNKAPHDWLVSKFGKRKAKQIEAKIAGYFKKVKR